MLCEKNLKEEVKFDFGNWWRPEYYSELARREKRIVNGTYNHGQDYIGNESKPEAKHPSLANYFKKPSGAVRAMTLTLAADVFCLPLAVQARIAQDKVLLAPFDVDLLHAIDELGDCGILHVNKSNSDSEVLKKSLRIGRRLYLTEEAIGMPVKEYLFYLLENRRHGRVSAQTIREWSGIPAQRQGYVYERLVEMLRACLQLMVHKDQLKYAYAAPFDEPSDEVANITEAVKDQPRRDIDHTIYGAVKKVTEESKKKPEFDQTEFNL